jgi:hypothetical protein
MEKRTATRHCKNLVAISQFKLQTREIQSAGDAWTSAIATTLKTKATSLVSINRDLTRAVIINLLGGRK